MCLWSIGELDIGVCAHVCVCVCVCVCACTYMCVYALCVCGVVVL